MSAQQTSGSIDKRDTRARNASIALLVVSVPVLLLGGVTIANAATSTDQSDKVDICHASASMTNPYTVNKVDVSSVDSQGDKYLNGHGTHTGPVFDGSVKNWGDVIPPFTNPKTGTSFPGYNWSALGQAIWANNCAITEPSPSPTPTETSASPTPTETSASPTPSDSTPPAGEASTSAEPVAVAATEMPSPVAVAEQGTAPSETPLPVGAVVNAETGAITVPAGGGGTQTSQAVLWGAIAMLLGGSGTAWGSFRLVSLRKNEAE